MTVQEIHALIRDGRAAGRHERAIDELRREVREAFDRRPFEAALQPALTRLDVLTRVQSARDAVGFQTRPYVAYVAYARDERVTVPALFNTDGPAVEVIEAPRELRANGFILADARPGSSMVVRGELRRRVLPDYLLLELWRDGVLIGVAPADRDFLMWASRAAPIINPLVLAESVFLFVDSAKRTANVMEQRPTALCFELHLAFDPAGPRPILTPGSLQSLRWQVGIGAGTAPANVAEVSITQNTDRETGVIAFELVSRVYNWFGFANDAVPYTGITEEGHWMIDADAIIAGGAERRQGER
jgi:hypothetical protein